ncbi:MAG: XRE family transcriptional regulator [Solobacterium sp.]|nr:XRE family transcriptional regulator [Solobacterium sp.]
MQEYIIKHKDLPVLTFTIIENVSDPVIRITWITENRKMLPLDMIPDDEGVVRWIKSRTIPKNRAFVNSFLAKCGLSINRPMDIITVSKGLSLNDVYWITETGFEGTFEDYNLYKNNFSNILGLLAFTGYGSSLRTSLDSSPEFTTNGILPKCWRRINGKVYLFKGGTTGASNTGFEPYSEYYASRVASAMNVNAVPYKISNWKGVLCSTCELFTSQDLSYIPVGRIVRKGGMQAVRKYYESLGQEYVEALNEMLVFDAVICNTDRHFGNFGFLIDNETNTIVSPAPLFDHGNSLFNFATGDAMKDKDSFQEYVDTLLPRTYDSYMEAKAYMSDRQREQVRKLLTYRLEKNPRYNVSPERYELISGQINKRARLLLK